MDLGTLHSDVPLSMVFILRHGFQPLQRSLVAEPLCSQGSVYPSCWVEAGRGVTAMLRPPSQDMFCERSRASEQAPNRIGWHLGSLVPVGNQFCEVCYYWLFCAGWVKWLHLSRLAWQVPFPWHNQRT